MKVSTGLTYGEGGMKRSVALFCAALGLLVSTSAGAAEAKADRNCLRLVRP